MMFVRAKGVEGCSIYDNGRVAADKWLERK